MEQICATCGTKVENPISGFCENDHDNWLEIDSSTMEQLKQLHELDKREFENFLNL